MSHHYRKCSIPQVSGYLREQRKCLSQVTEGWSSSQKPNMQQSQSLWRKLSLSRTNPWWCNMRSICRMARSVVELTSRWDHCAWKIEIVFHINMSALILIFCFMVLFSFSSRISSPQICRKNNWVMFFAAPNCQRWWDWPEELQWQNTVHYNVWPWQVWQRLQVTLHIQTRQPSQWRDWRETCKSKCMHSLWISIFSMCGICMKLIVVHESSL